MNGNPGGFGFRADFRGPRRIRGGDDTTMSSGNVRKREGARACNDKWPDVQAYTAGKCLQAGCPVPRVTRSVCVLRNFPKKILVKIEDPAGWRAPEKTPVR